MAVPAGFVELRSRGSVAWLRQDLQPLGAEALWAEPLPLAAARGRGGVGTLALPGGITAVVRPFRRGGALGNLLGDRYPAPSRVCRELELLCRLREQGVPVVTPLAALARRPRTFWRLRLLTQLEDGALPLPAFCVQHPSARRWAIEAAGVAIRLAFAAGLRHPDLHPDNVLCSRHGDKVRAVLVDLDRAALVRKLGDRQRDAMLVRMGRYVFRHRKRLGGVFWRADFLRFLRAVGYDGEALRTGWTRLWGKLRAALGRRGLA
jgi:hypothetical protein